MVMANTMAADWLARLRADYPDQPLSVCHSVVNWLLGASPERLAEMSPEQLGVIQQAIEYRYRILQQRYWNVRPDQGYQHLIKRLSNLFLIRNKISTWIALSRDRRRVTQLCCQFD